MAGLARELALESHAPEETERLAEVLAAALFPGAVLALEGDLGAGKTCFVRGLARGLCIEGPVASPTFVLMQAYEGRLPLYHFDAWMEGRERALFLDGGDEWLYGAGVSAVEWADRVAEWLPAERLEVRLEHAGEATRRIALRVRGPDRGGRYARALASLRSGP